MSYELTIVPMDYDLNILPSGDTACVHCGSPTSLIDQFLKMHDSAIIEYTGHLTMCRQCSSYHLELTSGLVDFEGPVTVVWD